MGKTRRRKRHSTAHQEGIERSIPNIDQLKTDWPDPEDRKEVQELDE